MKKVKKNQKKSLFSCFFVEFSLKYTKTVYINSVDNERGNNKTKNKQAKRKPKMKNEEKEIKPMTKKELKQMAKIITTSSNDEEAIKKYLKIKNK